MLNALPPATRVIAPSLRGYKGSSGWNGNDDLPGSQLLDQLARDYVDIISWVIRELADDQHGESQVSVVGWSLGNLGIVASYTLLAAGQLNEIQQRALNSRIKKVAFYEPPSPPVFFNPQDATTVHNFAEIGKHDGPARIQKLLEYLTGVIHFDSTAVQDWVGPDSRYQNEIFEIGKSLCLESSFRSAYLDDVVEFEPIGPYLRMRPTNAEETPVWHARAEAGVEALVNAPGVQVVQGLCSTTTLPECILGPIWVSQEVQLIERTTTKTDSAKSKARMDFVDAPCGHYMHALVPDLFWEKIISE